MNNRMRDNIEVKNLVPRFLNFYRLALGHDAESRFTLWKEHYGFAAVPPGEQGEQVARQLLGTAWDKYAKVIPLLEQWSPDTETVQQYLSKIKSALAYSEPVDVVLIFFVGMFDGNAFAAPYGDRMAICLPIEAGESNITLVHELTHLVHGKLIASAMSWEKTVAEMIFQEGLATQLSKHLVPGERDEAYVEHQPGWLQDCREDEKQIVHGIRPYLQERSAEKTVIRFTMGTGTTGRQREGYFAGWKLIGDLLADGWSFADIARVREENMTDVLRKYIDLVQ